MASKNKTQVTNESVEDFIHAFVDRESRREDSFRLIERMRTWSGHEARMWGPSIIGFGSYHYTYASGREGDAPLLGFSPRKAEFSLYVTDPGSTDEKLLEQLGTFRMGKACIYFKRLSDLDLKVLEKICKATIRSVQKRYGKS
ncbi:MAG: DUF1801 domain-containing protein [Flavobacteriales bacterium]|nr:DUF1801 domain-containing protein [Flavobacteriales bacterium]